MYSENMNYDHLYQSLVADNHPALALVDRAESEGFQSASQDYAEKVELSKSWEFDKWVDEKFALQNQANRLFNDDKHYEWFLCMGNGNLTTQTYKDILDRVKSCDEKDIAEFLLEAIKIIHELGGST